MRIGGRDRLVHANVRHCDEHMVIDRDLIVARGAPLQHTVHIDGNGGGELPPIGNTAREGDDGRHLACRQTHRPRPVLEMHLVAARLADCGELLLDLLLRELRKLCGGEDVREADVLPVPIGGSKYRTRPQKSE